MEWSALDSAAQANEMGEGSFPGLVGLEFSHVEEGLLRASIAIRGDHMAPNGFLHAGVVVTLADTACGYGVRTLLPEGSSGFTTVELKANYLGTARDGTIDCEAQVRHAGRTTQVWDATVTQGDRTLALFRCTQLILYPR